MRYIIIYNPVAGISSVAKKCLQVLKTYFEENSLDFTLYESKAKGDITRYCSSICDEKTPLRIYGVGGDGTLLEIARGVYGRKNVEIGIFPTGSGNDYVRSFGEFSRFLNIKSQINSKSIEVDVMDSDEGCSMNVCSVGFDAKVAYEMVKYKNKPFISGSMSYDLAVAKCFLGRVGDDLELKIGLETGDLEISGRFLFALLANGKYYGGGYNCAPHAKLDDGVLNVILIKKPPLFKIPKMVKIYKKGEYLDSPIFKPYLFTYNANSLEITSKKDMYVNCDGECVKGRHAKFSLSKYKIKFILPDEK